MLASSHGLIKQAEGLRARIPVNSLRLAGVALVCKFVSYGGIQANHARAIGTIRGKTSFISGSTIMNAWSAFLIERDFRRGKP